MWKMEIVSEGEVVAEHSNVTAASKDFWIPNSRSVAQGYVARDRNGDAIEYVCGDNGEVSSSEITPQGLLIVRGLWAHFEDNGGFQSQKTGHYYGVFEEDGSLTKVEDLDRSWSDPRLPRKWILHSVDESGAADAAPALVAAETPPLPVSSVAGALGAGSRSIIGG